MTEELEPHLDFLTNLLVTSQTAFWPSIVNIYKPRPSFINPQGSSGNDTEGQLRGYHKQ
jgi:hypothetical protein